jgi:NAD(P)-dependent dehydrogenase (short-subunit alcohol dehydrogenase family)
MAPQRSIIITGAAGGLGSHIALQLAARFPGEYHLLLAARNPSSQDAKEVSSNLEAAGAEFSWLSLDLSFEAVSHFVELVEAQLAEESIPRLYYRGLVIVVLAWDRYGSLSLTSPSQSYRYSYTCRR